MHRKLRNINKRVQDNTELSFTTKPLTCFFFFGGAGRGEVIKENNKISIHRFSQTGVDTHFRDTFFTSPIFSRARLSYGLNII